MLFRSPRQPYALMSKSYCTSVVACIIYTWYEYHNAESLLSAAASFVKKLVAKTELPLS